MAIEIILSEIINGGDVWACWLLITQDSSSWLLPAAAPAALAKAELQAYFDGQAAYLLSLAQAKAYGADIYSKILDRRLLKAFAQVVMDEINILRAQHSLPARTWDQLTTAVKNKLKQM